MTQYDCVETILIFKTSTSFYEIMCVDFQCIRLELFKIFMDSFLNQYEMSFFVSL